MPHRVDVAIISGSTSDAHIVEKVTRVLDEHKVPYEHHVISAHRNPDELDAFLKKSHAKIFIAIAVNHLLTIPKSIVVSFLVMYARIQPHAVVID